MIELDSRCDMDFQIKAPEIHLNFAVYQFRYFGSETKGGEIYTYGVQYTQKVRPSIS